IIIIGIFSSCKQASTAQTTLANTHKAQKKGYKAAYFASGCFWCSESIFNSVIGVRRVIVGYSGGQGKSPNYHNYERLGYAETIKVIYDPKVIDFATLLTVYFGSQNPVQQNGQGPDRGTGYRSIIFYQNAKQKELINAKIKSLQQHFTRPIAAEVIPFDQFWIAERYHQDYEEKHPNA